MFEAVNQIEDLINKGNAFTINGDGSVRFSLESVSLAGDLNGDKIDDLAIGAPFNNSNGYTSGSTYIVFGKKGVFASSLNLSTLNGRNGFVVNGTERNLSGRSVSNAGDINGDGFDDLAIGAPITSNGNGYNVGSTYIVFGKSTRFSSSVNVSTLNGSNGFTISGVAPGDRSGYSVSNAGDINGDGFDDLAIGAPLSDPNGYFSGTTYIVFGKSGGFSSSLNLSTLNGSNGFAVNGSDPRDFLGESVSNAGDINGDGFDDLAITSDDVTYYNSGNTYIIFGKSGGFASSINVSTLNGSNGFTINGNSTNSPQLSVSNAGDINGDGFDDIAIGETGSGFGFYGGRTYIVFGKSGGFSSSINASSLNGTNGFILNGSGSSVSNAGDINGDGFDDIAIGASRSSGEDATYIVFGKSTGFASSINLSSLNGSDGFVINGAGFSVSNAGDINGDKIDDIAIGALQDGGSATIVFGFKTINGDNSNNRLNGTASFDFLNGNGGNDTLNGLASNDTLDGGEGNDVLNGGLGNDVYIVDNLRDVVRETSTIATVIDTVKASISYSLGTNLENLSLLNTDNLTGTGNNLNNIITGNTGNNILNGGVGDDTLDGGEGNDTLNGGDGNDLYIVNNLQDVIQESSTIVTEVDTVKASISLTLGVNLENLTLTGEVNANGTGNNLNNLITGNDGINLLNGSLGNDTLLGQIGNDTFNGAQGNDTLTGGQGRDRFSFSTPTAFISSNFGIDTISDFVSNNDKIVLSKRTFTSISSTTGVGFSDPSEFAIVATDEAAAISASDIVYNSANGKLFYNQNGTEAGFGTGAQFTTITGNPTLGSTDFAILS